MIIGFIEQRNHDNYHIMQCGDYIVDTRAISESFWQEPRSLTLSS